MFPQTVHVKVEVNWLFIFYPLVNCSVHIPIETYSSEQKKGTHRAPVSKKNNEEIGNRIGNTAGGKTKGKGEKIKKGTQLQDGKNLIDEQQLQAKCVVIMEIIGSDLVPEAAISIINNPPFIITYFAGFITSSASIITAPWSSNMFTKSAATFIWRACSLKSLTPFEGPRPEHFSKFLSNKSVFLATSLLQHHILQLQQG